MTGQLGSRPHAEGWKTYRFAEMLVGESISYGIVQPGPHTAQNSVPIIRVNNIRDGRIETDDVLRVSAAVEAQHARTRLHGGELLITVVGTVGQCAIVPPALKGWNVVRAISVARIKPEFDVRFVRYCFQLGDVIFQMYGNTNDTVQPTLNLSQLRHLELSAPDLNEQRKIADLLGRLDEKINLLRRQSQTLEAMSEAMFQQWFIEEPSPTWTERPLSSIATFLNGLACQKYPPANNTDKLPVLKIRELSTGITDSSDWASCQVKPEFIVEAGDVIFAWSASLMVKVWDGERCVLNQHLFKVTSDEFPKWFYLRWCKHHLNEFIAISASHATTMGHIKRGDLDAAIVLVPSRGQLLVMTEQMSPLLDKQIAIARQRRTLESLRDTLLPKLMSGEVRVAC